MSPRRMGTLLAKDLLQSPRSFLFIWAIVVPVVLSLAVSLIFGTFSISKPKLGLVDEGNSRLLPLIRQVNSLTAKEYATESDLKTAVETGAVDMGVVLPQQTDGAIINGERLHIKAYTWGESLAKNRTIVGTTLVNVIRQLAGQEAPVEVESITLGDAVSVPWNERLLPLIVLMAVFLGGLFLPAASVINEKIKKTMGALLITPATVADVFLAKGLVGVILSLFMGIVVLILNRAFGAEPVLLLGVLALGAVMAAEVGLLCGAVLKDITTLFAIWKAGGILLFGPALVYMFPQIPEWIARILPTYYVIQPIIQISQQGGGWSDIAANVLVLAGVDICLIGLVLYTLRRTPQHAT